MSTWEVIKICAQYIWIHNVPCWKAWFIDMIPFFVLVAFISYALITEIILTKRWKERFYKEKRHETHSLN